MKLFAKLCLPLSSKRRPSLKTSVTTDNIIDNKTSLPFDNHHKFFCLLPEW